MTPDWDAYLRRVIVARTEQETDAVLTAGINALLAGRCGAMFLADLADQPQPQGRQPVVCVLEPHADGDHQGHVHIGSRCRELAWNGTEVTAGEWT